MSPLRTLIPLLAVAASPLLAADSVATPAAPATPAVAPAAAPAPAFPDLTDALTKGTVSANLRYRWEHVEQNNLEKNAEASTLRAALGYETKPLYGVSVFAEYEGVYTLGEQLYNSPNKAMAQYPRVNDPTGNELNQAYVKYVVPNVPGKITAKVGRFEYLLGNQRLVGNVGWRQNHQSFEGATLGATPVSTDAGSIELGYAYLNKVLRVFGEDSIVPNQPGKVDMSASHVFSATGTLKGKGKVTAYGVLLGFDEKSALVGQSSETYGVRVEGPFAIDKDWKILYAGEFAQQKNYHDNTVDYTADYSLIEGGIGYQTLGVKLGTNTLQGDAATDKFTTPLATGHAFNGWADIFLATPNNGLKGDYLTVTYLVPAVKGLELMATGYKFTSQTGSFDYGKELDLRAEYTVLPVDKNWMIGVKYAHFIGGDDFAQTGSPDGVTKVWAYTQYAF
jgi:hypothetical protein